MIQDKHREAARAIAADLFTTGSGRKGDHLQIVEGVPPNSVYLAGWCETAVADRIATALTNLEAAALARADAANKLARLSQENELRWMRLCDLLHTAVCQSVALLNTVVHEQPESREAHEILRQVLADYADAPHQPSTTEIENRAYARGRDEAKAEDAGIVKTFGYEPGRDDPNTAYFRDLLAPLIADAILASSPGPALEERLRAEIAERVEALPLTNPRGGYERFYGGGRKSLEQFRDDVLAAIREVGSD